MSEHHSPQRTCIGCRRVDDQAALLRWVLDRETTPFTVVPDPARRKSGRGAWMHPQPECAAIIVKKRAFARAFRAPVPTPDESVMHAAIDAFATCGRAEANVQPESGSED
ncbi:YlxR family protein [Zhihengliuella flava]|uniref:RNA-binding protein YlxR (DUF448 family) n=1 Tax=Zhihengliuella flava TaxID=1285193 RepID=A0A931DBQ3_9MICC|nr:putative RNA-binding protein YlxR (DUF448 family) [Zhihengliuella flava]